ncbi:hypothetical protein ABL78_2964 [Leptomonas seymouri]|uniref:Uncharacterized protein n=1 Tax=Leptomonas seymouri TaxID=5684 RepID=A0A0N1PCS0_LEPSE|nr:hypothetical protein ABL78_2964 [Leptomonas seymouri]|eukprot:KPI87925.1 hypothetical protein ABL78_2964 [Leptomonas seymouri]
MVQPSQYPDERQARRILELSYPEVDEEIRENLAYLVSARRMKLDDALGKLDTCSSGIDIHQRTRSTPTTATAKGLSASSTISGRRAGAAGSTAAGPLISPELPIQRSSARNAGAGELGGGQRRVNNVNNDEVRDAVCSRSNTRSSTTATLDRRSKPTGTVTATPKTPAPATTGTSAFPSQHAGLTTSPSTVMITPSSQLGGSTAPDRYNRSRLDTRVSHSYSELTELQESNKSILRSEEESGQHSAPDLLSTKASGAMGSGRIPLTQRQCTGASTRPGRKWREVEEDAAAALEPTNKAAWTEPTDKKCAPSLAATGVASHRRTKESGEACSHPAHEDRKHASDHGELAFANTKLVTEEEKAVYEEKMKDMLHYWYREETSMYDYSLRSLPAGQVLFFTTSMTGDRRVRDCCRLMDNLLYLKLIPHHTIDVADNEFFLRRVRKMFTHNTQEHRMPDMPLLFVDNKLIGDFTTVQELEDAGELDAKLLEAGCSVLRPRVVAELEAKRAGLPTARLVLPAKAAQRSDSSPSGSVGAPATAAVGDSSGTSTAAAVAKRRAVAATAGAASSTDRKNDSEGEDECHPAISHLMRRTNVSEAVPLAGRPPVSVRTAPARPANPIPHPPPTLLSSVANGDRRPSTGEPTCVFDDDNNRHSALNVAPSTSECRLNHERRLDRITEASNKGSSGAAPRTAMGEATSSYGTKAHSDNQSSGSTAFSTARTVRAANRNTLGRIGADVADAEKCTTTSSTVPRLPSLASRGRECTTRT